ncbi:MAG TPA: nucleotidyltransferase domain-containing protein [Candidatus Didemnitutus sp.]|nr:nucleotidyltransferase domain-containing protein [Candidatus Didemnitutus sp.]
METHHAESIRNLVREFQSDANVAALLLGGSLAHGFARPDSDIDVSIVVSSAEFARRQNGGQLHYNNRALCTYEKGYIDGKYVDLDFLRLVAQRGSDPARYAYQGNRILFSRVDGLEQLLGEIVRYPAAEKASRAERFGAQLLAWRWYYSEALRQQNPYLVVLALQKIVLFSCRLVLNANEMLYPFHKWMLRVASAAPRQPAGFPGKLDRLLKDHSWTLVQDYVAEIFAFAGIDLAAADAAWPTRFMKDTELRWMTEEPAIDDL